LIKKIGLSILLVSVVTSVFALAYNVQSVRAKVITVPDDYPTIQQAVDAASLGDTIFVRAGTYHENVFIGKTVMLVGEDRNTTVIDGNGDYRRPVYINAENVLVTRFTIRNSRFEFTYAGIGLYSASSCNISGNIITANFDGIFATYSFNNTISNNIFDGNNWNGVHIRDGCTNNVIISNTIQNNRNGMSLEFTTNNYVLENYIAYHEWDGIDIMGSRENTVIGNTIKYCFTGLYTGSKDDNMNVIYHNSFMYNTYQVTCYSYPNTWDNGYPSGGNYWSNYGGSDFKSGPYQNETGEDGLGDTKYGMGEGNVDNYPLMKPYTPQRILPYTDKYTYHAGDVMKLGLHVINLEHAIKGCVVIWIQFPNGTTRTISHVHSKLLQAGLDYNNPSYKTFTLPSLTPGIYKWHAAILEPTLHAIILEDTAQWQFI